MKIKALECMKKEIGDGQDMLLWSEPWLNEGRLIDLSDHNIPHVIDTCQWKVSEIIHNGNWQLSIPALSPLWTSITSIRISNKADTWKWKATSTGDFSFASRETVRDTSPSFALHNVVWFPFDSPKMSCFLLKGLLDRLPTRSKLLQFGIIKTDGCVLCSANSETRKHLFLKCVYSAYIWALCKLKLGFVGREEINT